MEFRFQISRYDGPYLEEELARALEKRVEADSRRKHPELWRTTDSLNAAAEKGRWRRSRRVNGVVLLALGLVMLIPGLVDPAELWWALAAGAVGIVAGLLTLLASRRPREGPGRRFLRAAGKLLRQLKDVDGELSVDFNDEGFTVSGDGEEERTPYAQVEDVFEEEHLWMVIYSGRVLTLQKKDLTAGSGEAFVPFLTEQMKKQTTTSQEDQML